ncbi:MAG: glycoside hydrolase [Actinomycetota bacterium]|nr:glycoside hydrolase [Actinomycetota bacterium]PLS75847.1 MAG: hypothetical protein CYG61_04670 [Actinomycetota bacterium]
MSHGRDAVSANDLRRRGRRPSRRATAAVSLGLLLGTGLPLEHGGAAASRAAPGAEVPITPVDQRRNLAHNSPMLLADPTEERFVVAATRLDNPDFGCALHVSGDGGRSWVPAQPIAKLPEGADKCYAPEVAFDDEGTLYYLFVGLAGEGNSPAGAYLVTSSDRAVTFSAPRQVLGPERYMVRMAVDRSAGRRGRLHLVWLQASSDPPLGGLPPPPNPIMAAYSDDGGRTFSEPVQVSDPRRQRVVAPALAIGPDHRVHVLYYDLEDDVRDYQGLEGPRWEGRWSLVMSTSTDGGRRFGRGVVVDDQVVPPERVMLIYTMPPPSLGADGAGRVFAAWHDARNGDWDVFVRRSLDRGRSWQAARRVNDDRLGNGRHQYLPRLAVSPGGRLDAVFYDRRNDRANVRNDVVFTSSRDSGRSFTPNAKLTTESSNSQVGIRYPIPSARGQVEFGSRLGLLSERTAALASWPDTRHSDPDGARQEVRSVRVEELPGLGGSRPPWLAVAAVSALLALGAGGYAARRRRRGRPSPAPPPPAAG